MKRAETIERAVVALLREKTEQIEDKAVIMVQIQVQLYPKGGLPRRILLQTNAEHSLPLQGS